MATALRLISHSDPARRPRQAEQLRTLGAHVTKVTHELRVPLSLISGSLQSIEQFVEAAASFIVQAAADRRRGRFQPLASDPELEFLAAEAPNLLAICRQGTVRIDHVLAQLRGYTATVDLRSMAVVDLSQVVGEAIQLASIGRPVVPSVACALSQAARVCGSEQGLSQVFVNLIGNAFDALSDRPDGAVHIEADACGDPQCRRLTAPHVHVAVRDNGPGVPDGLRTRLFQPFQTTKSSRSGLGLGLAIVREIVAAHGGQVGLEDSVTPGAAFVVTLPGAPSAGGNGSAASCFDASGTVK